MSESKTIDQNFVETAVKSLINNYEEALIERSIDDRGVFYQITVVKSDAGLLIGKAGANMNAIRTILKTIGGRTNQNISIKCLN